VHDHSAVSVRKRYHPAATPDINVEIGSGQLEGPAGFVKRLDSKFCREIPGLQQRTNEDDDLRKHEATSDEEILLELTRFRSGCGQSCRLEVDIAVQRVAGRLQASAQLLDRDIGRNGQSHLHEKERRAHESGRLLASR
jgi:hypothetical protein